MSRLTAPWFVLLGGSALLGWGLWLAISAEGYGDEPPPAAPVPAAPVPAAAAPAPAAPAPAAPAPAAPAPAAPAPTVPVPTLPLNSPEVAAARAQAQLLHTVYAATLDVIHERYFRNDRSTVPARALEDIFDELRRQRNLQARWIGVNARTMSLPHEPKDDFERQAAQAIRDGKGEYEAVEGMFYRRAQAIPLAAGCLSCHGSFGVDPKTPRFAGLVMKIPLTPPAENR